MFTSLDVFQTAHAMALHAGKRQALVAENMANTDTPGFRPRDLAAFSDSFTGAAPQAGSRATREGHLLGQMAGTNAIIQEERGGASPNGNAVSLEGELLRAVEVKRQHDRALAIYKSAMTVLRMGLGKNV